MIWVGNKRDPRHASVFYLAMICWHYYADFTATQMETILANNDFCSSDMSRQIANKGLDKVYQAGELLESPSLVWTLFVGFIFQFNQEPFIPLLLNLGLAIGFFAFIHRYSELSPIYSFLLLMFLITSIPITGLSLTGGYRIIELWGFVLFLFLSMRWLVNDLQPIPFFLVLIALFLIFTGLNTLMSANAAILVLLLQKRLFDACVLCSAVLIPLILSSIYLNHYTEFPIPPFLWITLVNGLFFDVQMLLSLIYSHDLIPFWALGGILIIISLTNGKGWDRSKILLMLFILVGLQSLIFFPNDTVQYSSDNLMVVTGLIAIFTWLYQSSIMAEKKHVRMVFITMIVLFSSVYPLWDRMDRPVKRALVTSQYHVSKLLRGISQITMHQN